jgi:membrane protease YdiL (CAAX protease family)
VSTPGRQPVHEVAVIAALLAWNTTANLVADGGAGPLAALIGVGMLIFVARRAGASWSGLGLDPASIQDGTRLGGFFALAIVLIVAVAAVLSPVRELLADDRFLGVTGADVAVEALLRIPLATAAAEEIAFRGVLLGMLLVWTSPRRALVISSALFGLWHVLPGIEALETTDAVGSDATTQVLAVGGQVIITGIAGAFFGWLRLRSGHVIAPALAHWALNAAAYTAGWLVVSRGWT